MNRISAMLFGVVLVSCATTPHPAIGVVWATVGTVTTTSGAAGASAIAYAQSRSLCERMRDGAIERSARGTTWGDCEQHAVVPYRDGAGSSVYWTFAAGDQFAMGSSEREICYGMRGVVQSKPTLKAFALGDCERIVITPLR